MKLNMSFFLFYRYVAISERGVERGMISIYDLRTLKKRKTLMSTEMRSREYVSICFSSDNKQLLSLGGSPDWTCINWSWQKQKPLQIHKIDGNNMPLYQCSFCPLDSSIICITGRSILHFYKCDITSTKMKQIETSLFDRPVEDYCSHHWGIENKLIVGTTNGHLLLFDNFMFHSILNTNMDDKFNHTTSVPIKSIEYIMHWSQGFFIGCDNGIIKTYKLINDLYILQRTFHIENNNSKIKCLTVSPSEEHCILTTENQQIYILHNFHTDILKSDDMKCELLNVSFHSGSITGLDVCIRKPIVVTCGIDRTVRVWNYMLRTNELCIQFQEQPHSIALHPSGLHVLVGFSDKLRLMNILMDDIRPYKEFQIKACSECQFSHGGHLFAAINVGLIQIYSTYTCEQIAVFRGHTGLVRSLYWSLDDTQIVSAGIDGAVYERKLGQTGRTQEHVQKGCRFTSALCTEDDKIYAVGDDRQLKEIIDKNVNKTLDAGVILTQLCVSHPPQRMLFAGTANGVIRSFAFPLTGVVKDYQCHSKTVSRMRITSDDGFLFSVSDDGCLSIFSIKEKDGRIAKRDRPDNVNFAEEILVTKSDLEEKNTLMSELKSKVDELTASNEYQLRLHDMNYQEKLKEVSEKYNLQIEHDRSKIDLLRDEKQELEMEFDEKITQLKATHANTLHAQDLEHQKSIMKEVGRYQKLQETMEEEGREYEQMCRDREMLHTDEITKMTESFEIALQKEKEEAKR
jgi:WD40 repeat protein